MHDKVLPLTLLLLGVASFGNSETCPAKEALYPCTCEKNRYTGEILVKCSPYEEDTNLEKLRKALSSLLGKKNVELVLHQSPWSDSNVTVPSDFFSGLDIKQLNIEYCEIQGLDNESQPPFLGLGKHLERLHLTKSFGRNINVTDLNFGHLQKLKDLYLSENKIKELGNDFLNNIPVSLKILSLKDNGIVKIGERAFSKLVNLQELYFEGDYLQSLQRSMFPNPATSLKMLSFRNTGLRTLPEDIFSNMPALRSADLITNGISRFDQRTWQPVWTQLSDVNVYYNPIQCDDSMNWMFGIWRYPSVFGECYNQRDNRRNRLEISMYLKYKVYG